MLTRRGTGLLALVAAPLFCAVWMGVLVWVAAALFVSVVVLIVWDSRSVPPAGAIVAAREHEPRLSVGTENMVTLKIGIAHGRPVPLVVRVREEPPPECAIVPGPFFRAILPPGGEPDEIAYTLRPGRRGQYAFGPIALRIPGVRNLVVRQRTVALDDPIRVYPNIRAIRTHDLASRRFLRTTAGLRRTRRPGEGSEFERLREYTPDDEYRRIDWKATARRAKPIARTFEAERAWNVILMLDTGRLMGAPVGDLTKLDVAVNAALLVAHIGARQGDRIGMMAFADRVEAYVPPASGPRQEGILLESLYTVHAEPTATDYAAALTALVAHRPQRSLLILLTDITDSRAPRTLIPTLAAAARHRVVVVTLRDPELDALSRQSPTDAAAIYERVAAERLARERALLLATISGRGIESVDVPADRLSATLLDTYLDLKRHAPL
jgi:uncharacterized protein (DUF58 family)